MTMGSQTRGGKAGWKTEKKKKKKALEILSKYDKMTATGL